MYACLNNETEYRVKRFKERNDKNKSMEEVENAIESGPLNKLDLDELTKEYGFVTKSFAGGITYLEFFCSNKVDIELISLTFFGGKTFGVATVFLEIIEQYYPDEGKTAKPVYQHTFKRVFQSPYTPFELRLPEPVYIFKDVIYAIRFELKGQETLALGKGFLKDYAIVNLGRHGATEVKLDFYGARAVKSLHQIPEMTFRLPEFVKSRPKYNWDFCSAVSDFLDLCLC